MICVKPAPGDIVASLNKALYENYLCLVALDKQQIYVEEVKSHPEKNNCKKQVLIRPKDSSVVAFS